METGTCSRRKVFRNGSCRSCPLLLTIFSVFRIRNMLLETPPYHSNRAVQVGAGLCSTLFGDSAGSFKSLGVLFGRIGVFRSLHLDAQGRADQIELLAEAPLQEAFVSFGDVFQGVTVHDDDGGVHPALMRVA